jgi:hypothetical protein
MGRMVMYSMKGLEQFMELRTVEGVVTGTELRGGIVNGIFALRV